MSSILKDKKVVVFSLPFKEITPLQQTSQELISYGAQVVYIEYTVSSSTDPFTTANES